MELNVDGYRLSQEHDDDASSVSVPVNASELRPSTGAFSPASKDVLIAKLRRVDVDEAGDGDDRRSMRRQMGGSMYRGQVINCEANVRKGVGKMHASFSPVSGCSMRRHPVVTIHEDVFESVATQEELRQVQEKIVDSCPVKVFGIDDETGRLRVMNPERCMFCNECVACASQQKVDGLVSVRPHEEGFIFEFETTGSRPAKDVLREAFRVIKNKMTMIDDYINDRPYLREEGAKSQRQGQPMLHGMMSSGARAGGLGGFL